MTLTKCELQAVLIENLGIPGVDAVNLVALFFEEIAASLVRGDPVSISGFGTFKTRHKNARQGRDPKTGKPFVITERTVAIFNSGRKLLLRINEGQH